MLGAPACPQRPDQAFTGIRLSSATAAAVAALRDVGLSERDTGTLLGLSHQRVQQLAADR
jgi:hypothetical protein